MEDFETLFRSVKVEGGDLLYSPKCLLPSNFVTLDFGVSLSFDLSTSSSLPDFTVLECAG